jgi:hypothetical protein
LDRVKRIEVEIGELMLEGFPAGERHRIAESMAAELGRLLSERGVPEAARSCDQLRAGQVQGRTRDAGVQLARAVYRGLEHA